MRILPGMTPVSVAAVLAFAFAALGGVGCSTYASRYYQAPLTADSPWIELEEEQSGTGRTLPVAKWETEGFSVSVGVPVNGRRQHTAGPCLFPVLPISRDYPVGLVVDLKIASDSDAQMAAQPGSWIVTTAGPSFHCLDCDTDEVRSIRPALVEIDSASDAQRLDSPDAGEVIRWRGTAEIRIRYSWRSELAFHTFTMENLAFTETGRTVSPPPIVFVRRARMDYTPWTTEFVEILDP